MAHFKIHPIVMGTKIFNKSMMTYQYGYGGTYTIPIYAWYIEGGQRTILVDTGEMSPIQSKRIERRPSAERFTLSKKGWPDGTSSPRMSISSFTRICTTITAKMITNAMHLGSGHSNQL